MNDHLTCTDLAAMLEPHKGFKRMAKRIAEGGEWQAAACVRDLYDESVATPQKWVAALRRVPPAMVRELLDEVAAVCGLEGDPARKPLVFFLRQRKCGACMLNGLVMSGILDYEYRGDRLFDVWSTLWSTICAEEAHACHD